MSNLMSQFGGNRISSENKRQIDPKNINKMLIELCNLGYFEKFGFVNRLGLKEDMFILSESIEPNEDHDIEKRRIKNGIDVSVSFGSKSGSTFRNWTKKHELTEYKILVNEHKSIKVIKE